jgi:hypothetical protein
MFFSLFGFRALLRELLAVETWLSGEWKITIRWTHSVCHATDSAHRIEVKRRSCFVLFWA